MADILSQEEIEALLDVVEKEDKVFIEKLQATQLPTLDYKHFDLKKSYPPYYYPPTDYKNLVDTLLQYSHKAKEHGILSLEADINLEVHSLLKELLSMAIDGCEPETIFKQGTSKIKWICQACENSTYLNQEDYDDAIEEDKNHIISEWQGIKKGDNNPTNIKKILSLTNTLHQILLQPYPTTLSKQTYIDDLEKELISVMIGVLAIQQGKDLEEKLNDASFCIEDMYLKNEKELSFEDTDYYDIIKELDIYNKKSAEIDDKIILQNPSELIKKLVRYSIMARKDGAVVLLDKSLFESNPRIREGLQKVATQQNLQATLAYVNKMKQVAQEKGYEDKKFLLYYTKELIAINSSMREIANGVAPRQLERYLLSIYPELNLDSIF